MKFPMIIFFSLAFSLALVAPSEAQTKKRSATNRHTGITKRPSKAPAGGQMLVVPPGAGQKLANGNEWKIMGVQSGGRLAIMEVRFAATSDRSMPQPHIHTREEEGWYVIDGELEFEVGDRTATAGPGTLVWAPRNIQHRYWITKAPVRYLLIFSPAGIEGLFKEVEDIRKLKLGETEFREELERRRAKYGARAGTLPPKKAGAPPKKGSN